MKHFSSIEKIDTGILYALEFTASVSVLLLAFGLIASMANVLTKGSVLTDNLFMQRVWAWTQCIAIDASVAGTIIRTFRYHAEGEWVKTWLYGLLSALLLFTAAIVSNIFFPKILLLADAPAGPGVLDHLHGPLAGCLQATCRADFHIDGVPARLRRGGGHLERFAGARAKIADIRFDFFAGQMGQAGGQTSL